MEMGMVMGRGRRADRKPDGLALVEKSQTAAACRVLYALAEERNGRFIGRWFSATPLSVMDWESRAGGIHGLAGLQAPRHSGRPDGFQNTPSSGTVSISPSRRSCALFIYPRSLGLQDVGE